jgi:2-polyprenyl-3-methyl-5-hydroxy-6-metoxy-1,4-benzoquinol methylase
MMIKDHFEHKASDYENDNSVKKNVNKIAETILNEISFNKEMRIMDFGSGTGFLLEGISPYVKEITAIDVSKSMSEQLAKKKDEIACKLVMANIDLTTVKLNDKFDVIISSMTLHHIEDVKCIMQTLYDLLVDGGTIALADLDKEKGDFHTSDAGVFHLGFERDYIMSVAKEVGFKKLKIQTASTIEKPHGQFDVFLLTGKK